MSDYSDIFGREPEPWREPLGALRLTLADESTTPWQVERARAECEALVKVLNEHPPADQGKPQVTDDEVCVEGSWFKRSELPTILGNFMRLADERGRELKEATITMTELRSTIVTDEMVEAGARAIFDVRDATDVGEWDDLYRDEQERYICDARAVLEAALGEKSE